MSSCSSHSLQTPHAANTANKVVQDLPKITVNGVSIGENKLANELQYHQGETFAQVVRHAAQALVIKELLLQEVRQQLLQAANGANLSIESPDQEEQLIQQLIEAHVEFDTPSEETCKRYYDNNRGKFVSSALMEVEHILLAAAKEDLEARFKAKETAKEIIKKLQANMQDFPDLANEYSDCPSKNEGGSLGQISKGQTVAEFERQIATLSQGLAQNPIESRYGVHVVNVTHKVEGQVLSYYRVAEKVKGYLVHRASYLAVQRYIQQLVEQADIEGITLSFDDENVHIE